jgi:hypothetical protein
MAVLSRGFTPHATEQYCLNLQATRKRRDEKYGGIVDPIDGFSR